MSEGAAKSSSEDGNGGNKNGNDGDNGNKNCNNGDTGSNGNKIAIMAIMAIKWQYSNTGNNGKNDKMAINIAIMAIMADDTCCIDKDLITR